MTQYDKIINHLSGTGKTLTSRQARKKYNITNLRARIVELRERGVCIYTANPSSHEAYYFMAKPVKAIIATAYHAVGGDLFIRP